MPEAAVERRELEKFVEEFGSEAFTTDGKVLTCEFREKAINAEKKYFVKQHMSTVIHKERVRRAANSNRSICLLTNFVELSSSESSFSMDLRQMMIEANIPLHKAQDQTFRKPLLQYCSQQVPDPKTLRGDCLKKLYDARVQRVRDAVGNNPIWMSVDETTDAKGQYDVNTIIGRLEAEEEMTRT
ncbi:uncharacterized protein LOC108865216 [Galendromus occidentalis]|uniref:Uncharacterized protein LOC108865216 n=1 Tax=Galendromus occidentalis TaxID=34638 RepID=A0AAJ7PB10_9ACAR|nr:uncharacterized protein LOC108865216 [Galendromus occidentalis]